MAILFPLVPLQGYVLVKRLEVPSETSSGIILTDAAKEKPQKGEVLAVGRGVDQVEAGQIILFKKYGPVEVEHNGEEFLLLEAEDMLAIIL